MKRWTFAWAFSFRATALLLALVSGLLLLARLLIGLAQMEFAETSFASFEVVVPLMAGLHAALLFAPDDEPALELLLAAPRPPAYLIYERLAALVGLHGGLALALSALAVLMTPNATLFDVLLRWLPPMICIVGLCLLATLYARRSPFGVLTAIVLCVAMALGKEIILPTFPNLWFALFYIQPQEVSAEQYAINRLFLLAVGLAALALVIARMSDEETLLGFQEAKNG